MTPQQTEKIFEPFQSNFEGGTGLGLAVVYQIVQAHEGKVWARSKPGQGTTFVMRLRQLEAEIHSEDTPETETSRDPAWPSAKKIALVASQGGPRG
jgi:K+-sensing histidine kinase KdpD